MTIVAILFSVFLFSKNRMVSRFSAMAIFVALMFLVPAPFQLHAENIDPDGDGDQYAQFRTVDLDNDGTPDQINFEPSGGGVTVGSSGTTGYAWAENIGWINTNPSGGNVGMTCSDETGTLSGYWWGQSGGWINLAPTGGGLTINASGEFSGNIWMQNAGWIKFDCSSATSCVKTSYSCAGSGGGGGGGEDPDPDPDPTFCELNPSDPSCVTPNHCALYPMDPSCVEEPAFCTLYPLDSSCVIEPPDFCTEHPTDATCVEDTVIDDGEDSGGDSGSDSGSSSIDSIDPDCSDGIDNDTDGMVDFPYDTDCESSRDSTEFATLFDITELPTLPLAVTKSIQKFRDAVSDTPIPEVAQVAATAGAAVSFPGILIRLINAVMGFLGYRKTRRHWGVVYDAVTKQPLDPAVVTLHDARTGAEVASAITDLDGRYSFLAQPGTYILRAAKTHYVFPSHILNSRMRDELYNDLYFGLPITLRTAGEVLTHNIPMDPAGVDWNEEQKRKGNIFSFFKKSDLTKVRILRALYGIGFILSVVAFIIVPAPYNTIVLGVYLVILLLELFGFGPTRPGVLRRANGRSMPFAIIRVWNEDMSREVAHRVTDKKGQYFILIHEGAYRLTIEEKQPDGTYRRVHTTEIIHAKRGVINKLIEVS